MAGNHILLPYKLFKAISSSNLSEAKSWRFINALVDYDMSNKEPSFPRGEENALWLMFKPELDSYKRHWKNSNLKFTHEPQGEPR